MPKMARKARNAQNRKVSSGDQSLRTDTRKQLQRSMSKKFQQKHDLVKKRKRLKLAKARKKKDALRKQQEQTEEQQQGQDQGQGQEQMQEQEQAQELSTN